MKLRTHFTLVERAVAAELIAFSEILAESDTNATAKGKKDWPAKIFGAMILERIATLIRKDDKVRIFTNKDMVDFCKFWNAEEPAEFNK